jgi:hypothetical protein
LSFGGNTRFIWSDKIYQSLSWTKTIWTYQCAHIRGYL